MQRKTAANPFPPKLNRYSDVNQFDHPTINFFTQDTFCRLSLFCCGVHQQISQSAQGSDMLARSGLASYRSGPTLLRSFSRDIRAALTQPPPVANHFPSSKHKIPQKRCANALRCDIQELDA